MQATIDRLEQRGLPGEHQRLKMALLTDQHGMMTATLHRLGRIARARGVESSAIDDVVQQTLLEAWSHLDRLTSPAGFQPWIDEICRNICRRYARTQQTNLLRYVPLSRSYQSAEAAFDEEDFSPFINIPDPDTPDPFEALSYQELAILLDRALGLLPQETRQVIELCHLLELPHSEVAERLGISVGALQTRLHRARRHLRQILSGPLYEEAASFDLVTEPEDDGTWVETHLWCSYCGRCHLQGSFIETEPGGNVNVHLRCPGCAQLYGLDMVHSMGLVSLGRLRSFRPAWKRTLQGWSELIMQGLRDRTRVCPWCGSSTSMQIADMEDAIEGDPSTGPHRFWIRWSCTRCGTVIGFAGDLPSVDQVVYWSNPQAREFIARHPRWLSTGETELEYAGQPTLSFQITDAASADTLTILAHRHTLRVLAAY
jgi:RNA polymerase sigma factor (sigma-70 family)